MSSSSSPIEPTILTADPQDSYVHDQVRHCIRPSEGCKQFWTSHGGNIPQKHQVHGHLPPIMKTIKAKRARHAGQCWRSRDELISDVLQWKPSYGQAKAGWPARTYIQQLCEDTGCSPEDLPEAIEDREKWRERINDIRAGGTTWWWWWWLHRNEWFNVTSILIR